MRPRLEKTNNVVSEQVRQKPSCTSTENVQRREMLALEGRGIALSMIIHVAKTKAHINFTVICAFVFAYMQIVGFLMRRLIY